MDSPLATGGVIGLMALVLFMTGMPIAFALGLTAVASTVLFLDPAQLDIFAKLVFDSLNDFALLAIPLFILMGNIFGGSTASKHLFEAGEAWLSRIRGGLGMSSVVAAALFAGLTGSSAATAAAIGRVAVPEMQARGVSDRIATGAVAAGGTLGILIPPSITLILYGIAAEQSIGQLFAGGVVPGIMVTVLFCVWIFIATTLEDRRRRSVAGERALVTSGVGSEHGSGGATSAAASTGGDAYAAPTYTWGDRVRALLKVLPFLSIIGAILYALYAGVATPSEAAAVGVLVVLVLIAIAYRGITWRGLGHSLLDATNQSTMILMITTFSAVIGTVLAFLSVPQELALMVTELEINKWLVLLVINLVLLVLGMFLPPVGIIVMVTPVLFPLITALNFDPIWFGVLMTVNMEIGLITPPVGLNLFVLKGIAPDISLKDIVLGTLPYVGVLSFSIFLMAVFPGIVTWLPNLMF
ncbi:MAG: TRAP transporter large permease [Actinomycetota bacterium]|nr:TRAP transporter large permease [Actinomycetota bacterium]